MMMNFLRWLASTLLLVPMSIGMLVGFVIYPFVFGFKAAAELVDSHIGWVGRQRNERREKEAAKLRESMTKMPNEGPTWPT